MFIDFSCDLIKSQKADDAMDLFSHHKRYRFYFCNCHLCNTRGERALQQWIRSPRNNDISFLQPCETCPLSFFLHTDLRGRSLCRDIPELTEEQQHEKLNGKTPLAVQISLLVHTAFLFLTLFMAGNVLVSKLWF